MTTLMAQTETIGNPLANIGIFSLFVVVTMIVVIRASKKNATADEFFTGGRGFSGPQNGIAIAGDYLSAASFLGIAGAIAVYGYDGFLYSIGFLVAWLVALLLVAELMRNTGKFTMADVLSFRLKQRPVRMAAATSTLTVSLFYLLAQMAGAGGLVALLLDIKGRTGQSIVIAVVGVLMIVYVLVGGMKGTTWVQIIKAVLLIFGAGVMTVMVLAKFGLNFSEILGSAQTAISSATTEGVANRDVLAPGAQYGGSLTSQINFISLALALVLGTAGLPHVLMRFYTVPTAKEARRSVVWAIALIGCLLPVHPGSRLRCGGTRRSRSRSSAARRRRQLGGTAAGLRARRRDPARRHLRGGVRDHPRRGGRSDDHRVGVVRARHLRQCLKRGKVTEDEQVRVSRITAVVHRCGSRSAWASWPTGRTSHSWWPWRSRSPRRRTCRRSLYSLYWKRFNTRGALCSMYGGLISTIVLIVISPAVSGSQDLDDPGRRLRLLPAVEPRHRLDPAGFILGIVGTLHRPQREPQGRRRDGGPLADRRRRREGDQPLTPTRPTGIPAGQSREATCWNASSVE